MSCPNCFSGAVHNHATPTGTEKQLYGYNTYIAEGQPGNKSTIIFYCDAFGLGLINNKILVDRYAQDTGCRVLAPEIIPGGGASVSAIPALAHLMKAEGWNWLNPFIWPGKAYSLFSGLSVMVPFMIRAAPPKAFAECLRYARAVKSDLPAGGKLGVAGFCWGGYQTTKLCAEPAVEGGSTPLLDAQFNAHPSALKAPADFVDSIAKFKVPYSCAVAEDDMQFNAKVSQQTEAELRTKLGDSVATYTEFRIHKGCGHGFAVRASIPEDKVGATGYEDAAVQAKDWFNKYLN